MEMVSLHIYIYRYYLYLVDVLCFAWIGKYAIYIYIYRTRQLPKFSTGPWSQHVDLDLHLPWAVGALGRPVGWGANPPVILWTRRLGGGEQPKSQSSDTNGASFQFFKNLRKKVGKYSKLCCFSKLSTRRKPPKSPDWNICPPVQWCSYQRRLSKKKERKSVPFLKLTANAPENRPLPQQETIVFQLHPIFRCVCFLFQGEFLVPVPVTGQKRRLQVLPQTPRPKSGKCGQHPLPWTPM